MDGNGIEFFWFDAISGIRGNRCIDFKWLEYSKKSQQNKKNNKYRKIVDNPWKLWYHNIRPWDKGKSIEEIRAETQTGFWERLKIK